MGLMWRDQLSVGNDVIDADHKYLIGIINDVELNLQQKNRAELALSLKKLTEYSLMHFTLEEKFAQAVGYTRTEHLNNSHKTLMEQLELAKIEFEAMGEDWSPETVHHFTNLLRNWLIEHVIKEDLMMKPAMQKYSPSFDPR